MTHLESKVRRCQPRPRVRRPPRDMKKILLATRGKVFTLKTLGHLIECTRLREFRAR